MNELRPKLDLLNTRGVDVCFVVLEDMDYNEMKELVHLEGTSMKLAEGPTQGGRVPRSTQVFFVSEGAVRDLLGGKGAGDSIGAKRGVYWVLSSGSARQEVIQSLRQRMS